MLSHMMRIPCDIFLGVLVPLLTIQDGIVLSESNKQLNGLLLTRLKNYRSWVAERCTNIPKAIVLNFGLLATSQIQKLPVPTVLPGSKLWDTVSLVWLYVIQHSCVMRLDTMSTSKFLKDTIGPLNVKWIKLVNKNLRRSETYCDEKV